METTNLQLAKSPSDALLVEQAALSTPSEKARCRIYSHIEPRKLKACVIGEMIYRTGFFCRLEVVTSGLVPNSTGQNIVDIDIIGRIP